MLKNIDKLCTTFVLNDGKNTSKKLYDKCIVYNHINSDYPKTLIVTHDLRCASALCDETIWIKEGKTYKIGKKELINDFFKI